MRPLQDVLEGHPLDKFTNIEDETDGIVDKICAKVITPFHITIYWQLQSD
jgi:hypothetical protein